MALWPPGGCREQREWRERRMEIGRREQEALAALRQVQRDREVSDRELRQRRAKR